KTWQADARAMMWRAFVVHSRRLALLVALVVALGWTTKTILQQVPTSLQIFENPAAGRPARLRAFAALPLTDELTINRILTVLLRENDADVAAHVVEALAKKELRPNHGRELIE